MKVIWRKLPLQTYEMNNYAYVRRAEKSPKNGRSAGVYLIPSKDKRKTNTYRYYMFDTTTKNRMGFGVWKLYALLFPENDSNFINDTWCEQTRKYAKNKNEEKFTPRRKDRAKRRNKKRLPKKPCRYCDTYTENIFCKTCMKKLSPELQNLVKENKI